MILKFIKKITGIEKSEQNKAAIVNLQAELSRLKSEEQARIDHAVAEEEKRNLEAAAEKEKRDLVPWADIQHVDGKTFVKDYNKGFINQLKNKFGTLTDGLSDEQIIQLYIDRENIELEDPRLDVKHAGIDEDGRIKIELDWNTSFIKHLADNGIDAETEEEAVQLYLSMITQQSAHDITNDMLSRDEVEKAFHDLDAEAAAELEEAARQIEEKAVGIKKTRKPRAKKNKES